MKEHKDVTGGSGDRTRRAPFLTGLLLVTTSVLTLELLLTRLLSVLTWYSLAFLVITMGLFGLTVGAIHVYLHPERYEPGKLAGQLASDATLAGLAIPASYVLLLVVPLRMAPMWTVVPLFIIFAAILALPFVPAGAAVAASLTRTKFPIGLVYAVDLAGAALGAFLMPALLRFTDAGTAILAVGCLAAAGGLAFQAAAPRRNRSRRRWVVLALLVIVTTANGMAKRGLDPLWVKGRATKPEAVDLEFWNSFSRVQVGKIQHRRAPTWGLGRRCAPPPVDMRIMTIDGEAGTFLYHADPGFENLGFLRCDVTSAVHHIRPHGGVAVIGVGGLRDLQSALLFGHPRVVGIEMNGRLLDVVEGPVGTPTRVPGHAGVLLVRDEGRSYLSRTEERFAVIQASLTDTWAATGAGAHALAENSLYTLEAWRTFLDRLEPGGIFTVSRWHVPDQVDETDRLASLAVAALLDRGVERPAQHIALIGSRAVATLLLGVDPLTPGDRQRLERLATAAGFELLALPGRPVDEPVLRGILACRTAEELRRATRVGGLDLSPPTDERPFFFEMVRLGSFYRLPPKSRGILQGNRLASTALVLSMLAALVLAAAAILYPLSRRLLPARRSGWGLPGAMAYFFFIGLGFMLAEMALLQRLSVVLGHPSYSLLVVLPGLIAGAGLGSLLSDRLPLDRAPGCYLFPLLIVLLLAAAGGVLRVEGPQVQHAALAGRAGFALAVTFLLGAGLGLAFPVGMRLARPRYDDETPWFWGLNGMGSVVGGCGALMISLEFGISTVFAAATLAYLLLLPAVAAIRRG